MSDSIIVTRDGALARVTFNRPAFLNAMGFEMGRRWRDVAHELTSDDSVGAVILDAAGQAALDVEEDRVAHGVLSCAASRVSAAPCGSRRRDGWSRR